MTQIRFEIRDQQGLTRVGRFKSPSANLFTPNLILPYSEILSLISQNPEVNTTKEADALLSKEDYTEILESKSYPFFISQISDPLQMFSHPDSLNINPKNQILHEIQFEENLDLLGISSLLKREGEKSSSESARQDKIQILSANFPNIHYDRYSDYILGALKHRLDFYTKEIFPNYQDTQFILEIPFTVDMELKKYYIAWITQNQDYLFGIKFIDIFKNLFHQEEILEWIMSFKEQTSPNLLWILGGDIFPESYALAFYLGFDCIDTSAVFYYSYKGLYITTRGRQWLRGVFYPQCACRGCRKLERHLPGTGKESSQEKSYILFHNIQETRRELRVIQHYIQEGTFRSYLEAQVHSSPSAAALLRLIDKKYAKIINPRFKLCNSHPVSCIGVESYFRPEVQNFITRVQQEITPAQAYKIILILPCSAKKPYSKSQSHQKFQKVIRKSLGKVESKFLHQVIITSPLGVIPRELENIFPAAHYDIPVTGDWDEYEITSTGSLLADWIQKYPTSKSESLIIIAHAHGGYRDACVKAESILGQTELKYKWIYTMEQHRPYSPSSKQGLEDLGDTLINWKNQLQKVKDETLGSTGNNMIKTRMQRLTDHEVMIRATLDYQLGKGAGDIMIESSAIINKARNPQYFEVFSYDGAGKFQIGRLYTDSGFIKLTPRGAQRLLEHPRNFVKINELNMRGSTVFVPILDSLDEQAHPGDEIIVLNSEGSYLGVGELVRSPRDLKDLRYGKVAALRKKISPKSNSKKNSSNDLDLLKEIES